MCLRGTTLARGSAGGTPIDRGFILLNKPSCEGFIWGHVVDLLHACPARKAGDTRCIPVHETCAETFHRGAKILQSSLAFWGIRKTTGVVSTRDSLARLEAWLALQCFRVLSSPPAWLPLCLCSPQGNQTCQTTILSTPTYASTVQSSLCSVQSLQCNV